MTVAYNSSQGITASADTTAPYDSNTRSMPGSQNAGDLMMLVCGGKPYSTNYSITDPGGSYSWTLLDRSQSGTTADGNGTGSVWIDARYTISAGGGSGPEVNTITVQPDDQYTPFMRAGLRFTKTNNAWDLAATNGADGDPSGTGVTAVMAANPGITANDMVVVCLSFPDDNVSVITSPSLSIPGCTVGTLTQQLSSVGTSAGRDGAMFVYTATITSGTASGVATFTGTVAGSDSECAIVLVRLRETAGVTTHSGTASFSAQSNLSGPGTAELALETENFVTGVDGGAISNSYGIFDSGADTGSATWELDNARSIIGDLSGKVNVTAGDTTYRTIDCGTRTAVYFRAYVYVSTTDVAGANYNLITADDSGATRAARLVITTAEELRMQDNSTGVGSTWAYQFNQWNRIEWFLDTVGDTQTVRVFYGANIDGTTPDVEITSTFTTGANIGSFRIGPPTGALTNALTMWVDAIGYRTAGWTGPVGVAGPVATVTTPSGATHQGTASFSGATTFTATGSVKKVASASFSGQTTFTATGLVKKFATAAFSGASTFTATGSVKKTASASFSGQSSFTANGSVKKIASAVFSGESSLTATGSRKAAASIALSGQSTFTATGSRKAIATASFSGQSSFTATGSVKKIASAAFSGESSLTATSVLRKQATVSFSGDGYLTTDGTTVVVGTASFSGEGTLEATGTVTAFNVVSGTASFSSESSLTATGSRLAEASVSLSGESSLTATGSRKAVSSASLSGQSSLTATGTTKKVASAAFSGQSSLTATGSRKAVAAATLSAQSNITATAILKKLGVATFSSESSLTATASRTAMGVVAFSGQSSLTGTGLVTKLATVSLSGQSDLTGTGLVTKLADATLSAQSDLYANAGTVDASIGFFGIEM